MITIVYAPTANSIPTPMHVAIEPLRLPPSPLTGPSASGYALMARAPCLASLKATQ